MISCLTVVISVSFLMIMCSVIKAAAAADSISITKPLRYGETLVSSGGTFELGFFRPGNSNNQYIGVWYKKIPQTPVWVANRKTPLSDSSGILQITNHSTLVILNVTGHIFWSTNSRRKSMSKNPIAQLLDNGNLVIRDEEDENPENFIWQSFDHPCDTQLPGMNLGQDLVTGLDRHLTSWTSSDDPAPGSYSEILDTRGYPQIVLMKGTTEQYRTGPWNGIRFSGIPGMKTNNPIYRYWLVINHNETYYAYRLLNSSVISLGVLNPYGTEQRVIWNEHIQGWVPYVIGLSDSCDTYALCGVFGSCNVGNSPQCGYLKGFEPKNTKAWESGDWSDGCVRRAPLACSVGTDGFWKQSKVKLPDTRFSWFNVSMSLRGCEQVCLKNCSCTAYSTLDIRGG